MSSPSALIVDDEPLLRAGLARQLGACWPQLRVVGEAGNVEEALQAFEQHQPSIVFLDIQMPGRSGLQLAEQLSGRCRIVFVTAHEHYALAAFERAAVDYLLKPVADDRLLLCVQRLQSQLQQSPPDKLQGLLALLNQNPSLKYLQWIKVSKRNEIRLLAISEIDYFQAEDKYLNVYSKTIAGYYAPAFLISKPNSTPRNSCAFTAPSSSTSPPSTASNATSAATATSNSKTPAPSSSSAAPP